MQPPKTPPGVEHTAGQDVSDPNSNLTCNPLRRRQALSTCMQTVLLATRCKQVQPPKTPPGVEHLFTNSSSPSPPIFLPCNPLRRRQALSTRDGMTDLTRRVVPVQPP